MDKPEPLRGPSRRFGLCMAYDAESDRVIAVGGHRGAGTAATLFHETWAFDYNANTWTNRTRPTGPSMSNWCALAYDTRSDRVVLFGGQGFGPASQMLISDETWDYDYNTNAWTQRTLTARPSQRWFHASAYDGDSDAIVVFGGEAPTGLEDESTWALGTNAPAWTNTNPSVHPLGRDGSAMAYDAKSDRIILFGGDVSASGVSGETWAFDLNEVSGGLRGTDYLVVGALAGIVAVASVIAVWVLRRRRRGGRTE